MIYVCFVNKKSLELIKTKQLSKFHIDINKNDSKFEYITKMSFCLLKSTL